LSQQPPQWAMASSFTRFLDHTQWRTAVGRNPLDEWSARRKDLYLTTPNTHKRQTSMPPVGFETTVSAGEGPQTYALDRAALGSARSTVNGVFKWGFVTKMSKVGVKKKFNFVQGFERLISSRICSYVSIELLTLIRSYNQCENDNEGT